MQANKMTAAQAAFLADQVERMCVRAARRMITKTKTAPRTPYASWKWRTTKAIDAKGYYIRGTDSAGTDYPIAVTCHGEKAYAEFLCRAANSHAELLTVLTEFCADIESTGGLDLETGGLGADPDWIDLADTYKRAKVAIARAEGRQP